MQPSPFRKILFCSCISDNRFSRSVSRGRGGSECKRRSIHGSSRHNAPRIPVRGHPPDCRAASSCTPLFKEQSIRAAPGKARRLFRGVAKYRFRGLPARPADGIVTMLEIPSAKAGDRNHLHALMRARVASDFFDWHRTFSGCFFRGSNVMAFRFGQTSASISSRLGPRSRTNSR